MHMYVGWMLKSDLSLLLLYVSLSFDDRQLRVHTYELQSKPTIDIKSLLCITRDATDVVCDTTPLLYLSPPISCYGRSVGSLSLLGVGPGQSLWTWSSVYPLTTHPCFPDRYFP
jgi:hypothetical protein